MTDHDRPPALITLVDPLDLEQAHAHRTTSVYRVSGWDQASRTFTYSFVDEDQ